MVTIYDMSRDMSCVEMNFFFFKQKTAYEMRISDWSSDVCSSDLSAFEQQQRQREHLQSYIDRFKAQATKARQAQSRIKALARLQASAPAHVDSGFSFSIQAPSRLPNPLLTLDQVDCGYDTPLLHGIDLRIEATTRIGQIGRAHV